MDYLKNKQYYIDLYDLFTIKNCLRIIHFWQKAFKEKSNDEKIKDMPDKEKLKGFNRFLQWELYATKAEEYRRKKETIEGWIERDRVKQNKYDNTPQPQNIHCSDCGTGMVFTIKHLEDYMDQPLRVLFFFECPACKKRKAVYDNGEEDLPRPKFCPKCKKEVETTHTKKGKVITWITTCSSCGFSETEVDDFAKSHDEWEKKEQHDKMLLAKYREDFCLTDEKGKEYLEYLEKMKYASEVFEEERQKADDPVYQLSVQLKKLSIVELEKLITEHAEKEKYIKLSFEKPEIGQFVIVPFTVQDADSTRKGYKSVQPFEKLLKKALEDTNWRLLSNSLSYRLGYLSGKLKGYERDEDLLELAGKKKAQQPPKIDYERKSKYEGDPMVSLARMFGKHEAIEDMQKKRLEKEPDGFPLEDSEGKYNCGICRELVSGNNAWWDLGGIKCLDCRRNIKEGVIPAEVSKNDDLYIQDWQLKADYSLHAATVRKLRRQGLLRSRELKRENGTTYCVVYLVKDNEEFLKQYPKKPWMKITYVDPEGKEIVL